MSKDDEIAKIISHFGLSAVDVADLQAITTEAQLTLFVDGYAAAMRGGDTTFGQKLKSALMTALQIVQVVAPIAKAIL